MPRLSSAALIGLAAVSLSAGCVTSARTDSSTYCPQCQGLPESALPPAPAPAPSVPGVPASPASGNDNYDDVPRFNNPRNEIPPAPVEPTGYFPKVKSGKPTFVRLTELTGKNLFD